jgi:urease gamma subunit
MIRAPAPSAWCRYAFTCFHDASYGADAPWAGSAWVQEQVRGWEAARLAVRQYDSSFIKMAARSNAEFGDEHYLAAQLDLWWLASRVVGPDTAIQGPPGDGSFLQHIVVTVRCEADRADGDTARAAGRPGLVRDQLSADGQVRELELWASAASQPGVDDLCWFDQQALGLLACHLVQASKLVHERQLAAQLRPSAGAASELDRNVLTPLADFSQTLLARCLRIEQAQLGEGARPGPWDRHRTTAQVAGELAQLRSERGRDKFGSALIRADTDLRTLRDASRGAGTLAHNLETLASQLSGQVPASVADDDVRAARGLALEFDNACAAVQDAMDAVARAQNRVAQLLDDRAKDLDEARTRLVQIQTAVLTAAGLAIAAITAGGTLRHLAAIIGAVGFLLPLLVINPWGGITRLHQAAIALVGAAVAGTLAVVGLPHGPDRGWSALAALTGAAAGWGVAELVARRRDRRTPP